MRNQDNATIIGVVGGDTRPVTIAGLIDASGNSRDLTLLMRGIMLLVVVLLVWSLFANVDEFVKAPSEVRTVSGVQLIQSEEGGSIVELLVQTDQEVKAGQPIARLLATNIDKERERADIDKASLELTVEAWKAVAEAREPDFSPYVNYPRLSQEARVLYQNKKLLAMAKVAAKRRAIEALESSLASAQQEMPAIKRELAAAQDIERRSAEGQARGVLSAVNVSESRERLASAEQRSDQQLSKITELRANLRQAETEFDQLQSEIRDEASTQVNDLTRQIRELDAEMKALQARRGQRDLLAPENGIIKNLPDTRVGAVIPPGGTVAELEPLEAGLLMEAKVAPRDIGFVRVGQAANVKIDAYDYSRFGSVAGRVEQISPSSFKNETTGQSYYKVKIKLDQDYVGSNKERRLIPGMTGEVDVVTGRKTVFQYITKPIFITLDTAFHER
jgi:HlyD family type I secretion membrane fusion protein